MEHVGKDQENLYFIRVESVHKYQWLFEIYIILFYCFYSQKVFWINNGVTTGESYGNNSLSLCNSLDGIAHTKLIHIYYTSIIQGGYLFYNSLL